MYNEWQVFIEYRPGVMSTFIYISRRVGERVQYLTKGGDETVTVERDVVLKDEVYFARYDDDFIGRLIVEALDKRGIKPPAQSYIEGKLEATTDHLNDLRQIIPKLAPIAPKAKGKLEKD